MRWFLWALIGYYALNVTITASQVGKPRKPLDAGTFAVFVVISGLVITGCAVALVRGIPA